MQLVDVLEIVGIVFVITAVVWAIGRQGISMGDVFGTLFTHGSPDRGSPRGVQEDDDAWEHIREASHRAPDQTLTEDASVPVPTSPLRRST